MRLVFKGVLLVVAALALSGLAAGAASATETHEWLLNGIPVKESTPVTGSASELTISRGVSEETLKCSLSDKGTVNAKGVGTITEWKLKSCTLSGSHVLPCEAGTLSATVAGLPWTTKLIEEEKQVMNEVHAAKEIEYKWECKVNLGVSIPYKVTCIATRQLSVLRKEGTLISEAYHWTPNPQLLCLETLGTETKGPNNASLSATNNLKAEKGELSFK